MLKDLSDILKSYSLSCPKVDEEINDAHTDYEIKTEAGGNDWLCPNMDTPGSQWPGPEIVPVHSQTPCKITHCFYIKATNETYVINEL